MVKKNKKAENDEDIIFEEFTVGESNIGVDSVPKEEYGQQDYYEEEFDYPDYIGEQKEIIFEEFTVGESNIPNPNSIEKQEIGKNIAVPKNTSFKNDGNKLNINNEQFFMTQSENNKVYFVRKQERNITYQDLVDFLNNKLPLIRAGKYFPTTENLKRDLPNCIEFGRHLIDYVSKWMSSIDDLPFSNITEMLIYFEIKDPINLQEKLNRFLDSMLNEIKNLSYIPTLNRVIQDSKLQNLTSDHITSWFRSRYKDNKVIHESLTELKIAANIIESIPVYEFLEKKKPQIEKFKFIPTTENIIQERPDFKDFKNLSALVYTWLEKNNLPTISRLKELTNQESYRRKLNNLLNPLKQDIEKFVFSPTVENITDITDEFDGFDDLPTYISRWLNENNIAINLTEYLHNLGIMSDSRCLKDFLDSKLPEIVSGDYYPTIKNLRKDQAHICTDINSMSNLNAVRAEWFNKKLGKSMTQLIDEFDPTYDQLGYDLQKYGYPSQFKSQKLRVMNAEIQVIILINQTELIRFNPPKKFNSLESLLKHLRKNKQWKFVDILTGEIFTLQDLYNGDIILHHINFRKGDLRPDNLVYVFRDTHGFINASERYYEALLNFLSNLLRENITSIKENTIPRSWKVDWRIIAIEKGIRLPPNRYIKTQERATIINHFKMYKKLDYF